MADTEDSAGSQADAENQPPAGDESSQADDRASRDELRKTRNEAQQLRRRLKELEDEKKQRETADLSESERLKKQIDEYQAKEQQWESERRQQRLERDALTAARRLGAIDPEAVAALVREADVEFGEDGSVKGADKAVARLKERHPRLFGAGGSANGGSGGGGTSDDGDMNARIRRAAGRA